MRLPVGKRQDLLAQTLDGLMRLFMDAARCYADWAETAKNSGRGFPTPDGYIAAIPASRGFMVASRAKAPFAAVGVKVINPWDA